MIKQRVIHASQYGEPHSMVNVLFAGAQNGFRSNDVLIFSSMKETNNYHDQANEDLFCKWLKEQVLSNLQQNTLIVVDNAIRHELIKSQTMVSK